ncbi:S26 family signal peptidase [Halanaeroarchaeum sulfurireducens]|uniref:Signal peptidase I n=1 Tax=Halanaeroarchaeum sulfurireducens TaxID=1604004 RepID=A0A0F7PA75_9EURY|nr:S26 family signal peptidase [Halanaeroarchaeum sulfurireducens]AKH96519.1 signal peptidase I [Halanaeroarchaeum sulfurireducens]ALG80921.1 signal peptidase I [Halanaeroarchaeum sulfurireducens]
MVEDPGDRDGQDVTDDGEWADPPSSPDGPNPPDRSAGPDPRDGPKAALRWAWEADEGLIVFVREMVGSLVAVLLVGLLLFAVSGVWPPMVAVESGSMEPNLQKGDLVFVMDEQRLAPDYATHDTGVVPYDVGEDQEYRSLGSYGDVIVYHPNDDPARKPVIHRTRFWVEEDENWLSKADSTYLPGEDCDAVPNCPAPHAGFITKGDNERTNDYYDQTRGISGPVKPEWIAGTAEVRIPWLGWVRLTFAEVSQGPRFPIASEAW